MGRELNRAFEKRQIGDYKYTFVFSKEDAEGLLKTGKTFVETIDQYLKKEQIL